MGRFRVTAGLAKSVIATVAGVLVTVGWLAVSGKAFGIQLDPPAFGLVTLVAGQGIRVNVVCSEHAAGRFSPGPCVGELMLHDAAGNTLARQDVRLTPGQAASLPLTPVREAGDPVGIDPCWIPSPGNLGLAIPSAEVFSAETGRTMLFMNPATVQLSAVATDPAR